jgi:cytochrome P450
LREEVETVIREDGWTKAGVLKLRKLDSFIKESMRLNPLGYCTTPSFFLRAIANWVVGTGRDVLGDGFTFSNGVYVPPGSQVGTTIYHIHTDENIYPNALEFDGFRFSRMRERDGESAKHHSSNTSHDFLYFGHGQHAWYAPSPAPHTDCSPGRFFAVNEIKLMLAYTLLNFDVKTKDGKRPPNVEFENLLLPNMKAELLYRRRTPPAGLGTDASA